LADEEGEAIWEKFKKVAHAISDGLASVTEAVENGWSWFTRNSTPKVVGWVCLMLLLFLSILAIALNDKWLDRLAIIGFLVTLEGFGYIFYDLYRMRDLAEAERRGARETAARHQAEHYRHCLETARLWLHEAVLYSQLGKGPLTALRLDDLAQQTRYIQRVWTHANNRWNNYATILANFANTFRATTTRNPPVYNLSEWDQLIGELESSLLDELVPLGFPRGDNVNVTR
jgi:hypothetical protein